MDKVALNPCPFCANDVCAEMNYIEKAFKIFCPNCPAEMRVTYEEANLGDGSVIAFDESVYWINYLIEQWNARA